MVWIDYRERLGIGFDDEQRFGALKNKLINLINLLNFGDSFEYTYADLILFLTSIGERIDEDYYEELMEVKTILEEATSTPDLISKYVEFCNCYSFMHKDSSYPDLFSYLKKFMNELNYQYELLEDNDGKYVFPKGIQQFDEALVSAPLRWLSAYPNTEKAWSKALREYAGVGEQNASDVADLFRKSLESFLREFFGNKKTLENNKTEYGRYLKAQGVPAEISNNLETLLQAYTSFMNGYAKHHDKTEVKVLEYLMYQTGNIMKLLITLHAEAHENAD